VPQAEGERGTSARIAERCATAAPDTSFAWNVYQHRLIIIPRARVHARPSARRSLSLSLSLSRARARFRGGSLRRITLNRERIDADLPSPAPPSPPLSLSLSCFCFGTRRSETRD